MACRCLWAFEMIFGLELYSRHCDVRLQLGLENCCCALCTQVMGRILQEAFVLSHIGFEI